MKGMKHEKCPVSFRAVHRAACIQPSQDPFHFDAQCIETGTKEVPVCGISVRADRHPASIGLAPLLLTAMQREASLAHQADIVS
jgi:hypothetical protein